MQITIEQKALQTMLNCILSCRCPVTEETERGLFDEYFRAQGQDLADFGPVIEAADRNPVKTPVHAVFEFCSYAHDDPNNFTITHNDIIRLFSSKFHINPNLASVDPMIVTDTSSFIVFHMMLPCSVSSSGEQVEAEYCLGDHSIRFLNVVFPPELELEAGAHYGLHHGTVVTQLTGEQVRIVENHLGLIPEFSLLVKDVTEVDFTRFQRYGNYRANVIARYERHFPNLTARV